MLKVLCGQQKGGVGKSTLAGNLAVGLSRRGQRVIIIDTDKQQTCVKWGSRRKLLNIEPNIEFATLMAKKGGNQEFLDTFRKLEASGQFDIAIIDAGGRDNPELRLSMFVANVLVAPCLPSQADIESLLEFDAMVGEVLAGNPGLKTITVLNKANTGIFVNEVHMARDALSDLDYLSDDPLVVTERPNFRNAWLDGKTAYDLDTESALNAQAEIEEIMVHL